MVKKRNSIAETAADFFGRAPVTSRRGLLGLAAASLLPGIASAQDFPARTIRLMVGTAPGGSLDFGARIIAQPLAEALGATVIVENKPGAGGATNATFVTRAPADGYTLLYTTATGVLVIPQAMPKPPFNALTDLVGINALGMSPVALAVNPRLGIKTFKEFVALSRTRQLTIASPGSGSLMHLMIEHMAQATGGNFLHVPYIGSGPGTIATIAGHVDASLADLAAFAPFHKDGKLVIVGVTTEKRLEAYPNVPTVNEDIPGFAVTNWQGLFAPAKTPPALIARINAALLTVAAREDVRAQFLRGGIVVAPLSGSDAFQKLVASDYQRWGKLLKEKGIVVQ